MTLPNLIIGGAPKAGTTALHAWLDAHPDAYAGRFKEPNFFNEHFDRGWAWYESLFDGRRGEPVVADVSPGYLIEPEAPSRIAGGLPNVKLAFVLRDPVARLESQYWYAVMRGTDSPTVAFGDFIRSEEAWPRRCVELGRYASQLRRYIQQFGAERVLVLLHEELSADRPAALGRLAAFAGLGRAGAAELPTKNRTAYPRNVRVTAAAYRAWEPLERVLPDAVVRGTAGLRGRVRDRLFGERRPAMNRDDRRYLNELYAPSVRDLESLLDRDLRHWLPETG